MRYQDLGLNEADNYDFGERTTAVLDKLGQRAGAAYNKLKGDYNSAKGEVESKQKEAQAAAEKEAKKTAKVTAQTQAAAAPKAITAEQIPTLVAKIVVSRTPMHTADIEELHDFDAKQLSVVYMAIDKIKERLAKLPRALRKQLKSNDFLDAQQRADKSLNKYLGDQPPQSFEAAETSMMADQFSESEVWTEVMLTDDSTQAADKMVQLMKAIARDFNRRNQAATGGGKMLALPESDGVVRLLSSERQVLQNRLVALGGSVDQLGNGGTQAPAKPKKDAWAGFDGDKPAAAPQPTAESLRRVRRLIERMNQA